MRHSKKPSNSICVVAAISVPMLLSACSGENQPDSDSLLTSSVSTPTQSSTLTPGNGGAETPRAASSDLLTVPAPTSLTTTNLRAGYVSLQWNASLGDTTQSHPGGDSVSFYRVFRNGEPLIDALSATIEDINPPPGQVVYSVQALKFVSSPEFAMMSSELIELNVLVPAVEEEQDRLNAVQLTEDTLVDNLNTVKQCASSYALSDGSSICVNHLGHAWPVSATGESGDLLEQTSSVGNGLLVNVDNLTAQMGPVPALPEWSVTQLSTGQMTTRELTLGSEVLVGERYLVNGVALAVDGSVFISGTLYQSYIPRSLGPSPGVLPVTNGYFLVQLDALTGDLIRFNRFDLARAPGSAASVNNGVLEMFQTGLVSFVDTQSLTVTGTSQISGKPLFSDESFIYTQIVDANSNTRHLRFAK